MPQIGGQDEIKKGILQSTQSVGEEIFYGDGTMNCLLDKKITIVCPTRKRPKSVYRFLSAIIRNTTNFSNFEIVFIHDDDDVETAKVLRDCKKRYKSIEMRVYGRPQHFNLSDSYYNWAWKSGYLHGDYFWMAQDDTVILTKNWNNLIIKAIEKYLKDKPDRICCAFALDAGDYHRRPNDIFGFYPMVTKEAVEIVGYIYPKELPTHGCEIWLREMYRAVDRYLPIRTVMIDQVSYRTHKDVPIDGVGRNMTARAKEHRAMGASFLKWLGNVGDIRKEIHDRMVRTR